MKDVIEMASEAGFTEGELAFMGDNFRRFAELVRADEREQGQKWFDAVTAQYKQLILAEREACAKLAAITVCDIHIPTGVKIYGTVAAAAIRNRGNT
jgi:hypothetical protein